MPMIRNNPYPFEKNFYVQANPVKKSLKTKNLTKVQKPKNQESLPVIVGLKVKPDPKHKYSVALSWKFAKKNKSPIYVGRSEKPLTTKSLVLDADNLTAPPLGPHETTFRDINIPDGKYYYVVVTKAEMKKGAKLILKPNKTIPLSQSISKGCAKYTVDKKRDS